MEKFLSQYIARATGLPNPATEQEVLAYIDTYPNDRRVLNYIFFEIMESQNISEDSLLTIRDDQDVLQLLYPIFLQGNPTTIQHLRENFPNAFYILQIVYALNNEQDLRPFFADPEYEQALQDLLYKRTGDILTPGEYQQLKRYFPHNICQEVPPNIKPQEHFRSLISHQPCGPPNIEQILHMLGEVLRKCGGVGLDYPLDCPNDKTLQTVFEFLYEQLGDTFIEMPQQFILELLQKYQDEEVISAVFVLSEFLANQERLEFLQEVIQQAIATGRWNISYQVMPSYEMPDIMKNILQEMDYEDFKRWFSGSPFNFRQQYSHNAWTIAREIFDKTEPIGDERENSAFALWLTSNPKDRREIERYHTEIFAEIADVIL